MSFCLLEESKAQQLTPGLELRLAWGFPPFALQPFRRLWCPWKCALKMLHLKQSSQGRLTCEGASCPLRKAEVAWKQGWTIYHSPFSGTAPSLIKPASAPLVRTPPFPSHFFFFPPISKLCHATYSLQPFNKALNWLLTVVCPGILSSTSLRTGLCRHRLNELTLLPRHWIYFCLRISASFEAQK